MSRSELVQGYLDGQLSRRVFIRGLLATGVTAAAAISYAGLLESAPAGAVAADFYLVITDNQFNNGNPVNLAQGQAVGFANHGLVAHTARDTSGLALFDTVPIAPQGTAMVPAPPGAGQYPFRCDFHNSMRGTLRVPVIATPTSGPLSTAFTITWAVAGAPVGLKFDVDRKLPGAVNWVAWKRGVIATSAVMTPGRRGTFRFRARVRRPANGETSDWSVVRAINVI